MEFKRIRMETSIMNLPNELIINIFKRLDVKDLIALSWMNSRLRDLVFRTRELNDQVVLIFKGNNNRSEVLEEMISKGRVFKQIKIVNVKSTTAFNRKGFKDIKELFSRLENCQEHVKNLTLSHCTNVEWTDLVFFLKLFPKLESVEMQNNEFWHETMSAMAASEWRRMYGFVSNECFPLTPRDAPTFEHLQTLKIFFKAGYQYTNIFQNAARLENLETDGANCYFATRYNNLKHMKLATNQLSANFFTDEIQNKISFSLNSFSVEGTLPFTGVAGKENISTFLEKQSGISDLAIGICDIPDYVLKQIVKMPKLKKLKVRLTREKLSNCFENFEDDEDEGPQLPFEQVFTEKNLCTEDLELYWKDDNTSLKFINLFPNCKRLHLSLIKETVFSQSSNFIIQFPELKYLKDVSLSFKVNNYNLSNIRVGPTLLKCELTWVVDPATPSVWMNFIENNPNIRKLEIVNGINGLSLKTITGEMNNLEHLNIKTGLFMDFNQQSVNDICQCSSLNDIELESVHEIFGKQIVKKFHTDAHRMKNDLLVIKDKRTPIMSLKIFKDAVNVFKPN